MNVLIIDEDLTLYDLLSQFPDVDSCEVLYSEDTKEILQFIHEFNMQVVILDIDKAKDSGIQLLTELKESDALLDVILLGQPESSERIMELVNQGATDYLAKPYRPDDLKNTLKDIQNKKALRKETFRLEKRLEKKYFFQGVVGKSPYMLEIFSLIEKIAKYFSTVLITGETGTGKEMIASAIHSVSLAKNRRLVICDCVSIPDNLFESELFGYLKGAFTGADRQKKGLFEEAHEGIIFLDEIGEIPLLVQAKLLRILEAHQYRPLGSNQVKKVNVKVIAATNRDLQECVKNGTFREDLYHRLNKVEIHLPPLRDKPEDIPLLVRYFLDGFNKKFSKKIKGISRQVQKLFLKYKWPGNIRELENVLERAAMLCTKDFIDIEDLPQNLQSTFASKDQMPFINKESLSTLDDLEKEYIAYILKLTGNNMRKTAQILNISRTTLYNKLDKYKIQRMQ
jgi:DNA-binding NtrC family response regulator